MMPKLPKTHERILKFIVEFYNENKYPPMPIEVHQLLHVPEGTVRYVTYKLHELGYVDILRSRTGRMRGILPLWKE